MGNEEYFRSTLKFLGISTALTSFILYFTNPTSKTWENHLAEKLKEEIVGKETKGFLSSVVEFGTGLLSKSIPYQYHNYYLFSIIKYQDGGMILGICNKFFRIERERLFVMSI